MQGLSSPGGGLTPAPHDFKDDMAPSKDERTNRLRALRRQHLRKARRAALRKYAALARDDKHAAGKAQAVREKHQELAQQDLHRIRARRERTAANAVARKLRHNRPVISFDTGWYWFDGKQVSPWLATELGKARASGQWKGVVVSGRRDRAKQQYLWDHAPQLGLIRGVTVAAPGTSNHERGPGYLEGAVDTTDWASLRTWIHSHQTPLRSYLDTVGSRDPVHFSSSGR